MPAKRKDDDGPITGVQAFAGELRAQREAAGLTQAQLAKLMGYSESVVAKLETCRGRAEVIARISRQAIWDRKDPPPPMLFAVLGEAILRQRVGDAQIMRDQLGHLADMAANPRVTVQVLPFGAAAHPGMLGPFLVASFDSDRDSAYLDNALDGQVTERRHQVARITLLYDSLRSVALSPGASTELIMKVADETWRT